MAAKGTSVTLGDHFDEFVSDQVTTGRFANVSEVVRAGLRLLEDEEAKLKSLRNALEHGEQSGFTRDFNIEEYLSAKRRAHTSG